MQQQQQQQQQQQRTAKQYNNIRMEYNMGNSIVVLFLKKLQSTSNIAVAAVF
jgi:hypothetical protein